jgi:hypothetical protein
MSEATRPTPEDMARDLEFDLAFIGNDVTPDNALRRIGRAACRRALHAEALNAALLAACELALPHLVNEPAADAVRAAVALARGD